MKSVKGFAKTCYTENLVSGSSTVADNEREDGSLIDGGEAVADGFTSTRSFHGGLGLKFKFPGDPKKWVPLVSIRRSWDIFFCLAGCVRHLRQSCGQTTSRVSSCLVLHEIK